MIDFADLSPPEDRKIHLLADFLELLCLTNPDKEISRKTSIYRIYPNRRFDEISKDGLLDDDGSENSSFLPHELNDNLELKARDWFAYLESRQKHYDGFYPFIVEDDLLSCKIDLTMQNKVYLFFLLCSNLRILKSKSNNVTTDFEIISKIALEEYLPGFSVDLFGKSGASTNYPTKLKEKIKKLAEQLNENLLLKEEDFEENNTGDGGLDIVAYKLFPEKDKACGSIICFAQCACSVGEWDKKKMQSQPGNWRHRISFCVDPSNILFIPFSYRNLEGTWFDKDKTSGCILIDRYRLCFLLSQCDLGRLDTYPLVNKLIEFTDQP